MSLPAQPLASSDQEALRTIRITVTIRLIGKLICEPEEGNKSNRISPSGTPMADDAGGHEGRAAERAPEQAAANVPSGAEGGSLHIPANARQPRIDLTHVPSSMEMRAASWRGKA